MWYLESLNRGNKVYEYEVFNAEKIKKDIIHHLVSLDKYKIDELWLYKVSNDKKTVGDTFIDAFVNKNGTICKVIPRGNKEYFKKLS